MWLLDELRSACKHLRKPKPQVFYSMRDIVEHFHVPLRTVALVFKDLETEGLLNSIRGSHTLLTGSSSFPRFPVRGVIGLPIWLNTMVLSSYTRRVNMELETRLRALGFVADLIFHHTKDEESHPDFAEQLLSHHLDAVIWQNPHPQSLQNLISLSEHGVRVLVIQTLEAKTSLPAVIYLQDWRPGYDEIARRWSETGVKKVWLPLDPGKLAYQKETSIFVEIMRGHGLKVEICDADVSKFPLHASSRKTGKQEAFAFLEIESADRLCNREPIAMERLARHARLALCRGTIRCPYLQHRGVDIEVVGFCAREISKKLIEDMQILPGIPLGVRHTFKAKYWPDNHSNDLLDPF